jgi:hypothetical protein
MALYSLNAVPHDQLPPERVRRRAVGKYPEEALQEADPAFGLRDREAESAARGCGTGTDVPELGDVLGRGNGLIPARPEEAQGLADRRMAGVRAVEQSEQNARIGAGLHQSWSA